MSESQPGLLSSVFGYLSREVQDFVTTATGGSTSTTEDVAPSSSRPRAKQKRATQRSRKGRSNGDKQDQDEEESWRERQHAYRRSDSPVRPRRRTSCSPTPSPQHETPRYLQRSVSPRHQKPSPRATSRASRRTLPPSREHTPPLDERASIDEHEDSNGIAEEQQEELDEEDEEPAPLPPPRALRRQPSVTMPGALFPRSPSMDPQPSAAVVRHVHFPTQPTYIDYDVPVPGPSSSPERPRPSDPIPRRPRATSVSEVSSRRIQEDNGDVDADANDAVPSAPSRRAKGKQRADRDVFRDSEASSPLRPSTGAAGGKGHASDARLEPHNANTSGEIRVRGKERELSAVREERRAREQWWETEVETTMIREEKTEYEDKIKLLEEEVQRLRAELAKRPTPIEKSADYVYSHSHSMLPPPPPPPPPPPIPHILPRIPITPATAQVSFANVRANLRHAGTPVEASINSSFSTTTTTKKRVGQPTIGVPADKMAAFLNEMKTVRLRRVFNAPADMCRPPPRVGSADNSFIGAGIQRPPRAADGAVAVGEKRKREIDTLVTEGVHSIKRRLMGPIPRSADASFSSTNSSFSQFQSRSQSQSQSSGSGQLEAGSSKLSRSYIPVRAWPSSSVDGTDVTPSLTSDGDAEQAPDEPSPPTPPQVPAIVVQGQEEAEEAVPAPPPPDSDPESVTPVPRPPTPPRRSRGISAQSAFDKRPPRSPLPAPSPRKIRPPLRTAARPRIVEEPVGDENDEDDPLASAVLDSPLTAVAARPRRERKPATSTTTVVAAATGGGVPRKARRRGSVSSLQSGGAPSKSARRRTLDEELRNSDGITEEDLRLLDLDLEPHVFTAVGTRNGPSERKGFLAHGGGAGIPVFMGAADTFDGTATEEHEDDIEIIDPPPPPPASLLPRKTRGRGRATAGMRRR